MTANDDLQTGSTSRAGMTCSTTVVKAPREAVYRAFTDPVALASWLVPGEMTGEVHRFDLRVGGGYEMSLYYSDADATAHGKTAEREDRYTARFVELSPPERLVETIRFDTTDPAFSGELRMTVTLADMDGGTSVSIRFEGMPAGIRPEDNEAGTRSSLEKLARYVEQAANHGAED